MHARHCVCARWPHASQHHAPTRPAYLNLLTLCLIEHTGQVRLERVLGRLPEIEPVLLFRLKRLRRIHAALVQDATKQRYPCVSSAVRSSTIARAKANHSATHLLTPNLKNSETICADPFNVITLRWSCVCVCILANQDWPTRRILSGMCDGVDMVNESGYLFINPRGSVREGTVNSQEARIKMKRRTVINAE